MPEVAEKIFAMYGSGIKGKALDNGDRRDEWMTGIVKRGLNT